MTPTSRPPASAFRTLTRPVILTLTWHLDLDLDLGVQTTVRRVRGGPGDWPGTFRRRFRVILPASPHRTAIGFDLKVLTLRKSKPKQRGPNPKRTGPLHKVCSGGVLLSREASLAVPSALRGLTSGFGMGPGVSPSLWPPGTLWSYLACPAVTRELHSGRELRPVFSVNTGSGYM